LDTHIIELFRNRDESALRECESNYGKLLIKISNGVLGNIEDSKECVNDTLLNAWNSIPPHNPANLTAYLCRIVRNISLNRWHEGRAKKRGGDFLLTELTDCIPAPEFESAESRVEGGELSKIIEKWLRGLPKEDRVIFMKRYWYGESLNTLAGENSTTAGKLAGKMFRLRAKLKETLEKEGVTL
jgi:RNA polymerase sigma-70 factor (ECF subfamily)